jgi:hypothetical protein
MIELFDLPQIGRSAARFDFVKLESLNGHYMRHTDDAALLAELEKALPYIPGGAELAGKLDEALRRRLAPRAVIEVDYFGAEFATFRLQYTSTDPEAPYGGLYKEARQLWDGVREPEPRWKRALFILEDFDRRSPERGRGFRMEIRQDFQVAGSR